MKKILLINPKLIYLMDPVLGDNGVLYCSKGKGTLLIRAECVQIYRNMFPIASVITPNQFEAELLSDILIKDAESALAALEKLHALGAKTVVITSTEGAECPGTLTLYGSMLPKKDVKGGKFKIAFPKISGQFTGTGDLFAALLLARWDGNSLDSLIAACEMALGSMSCVLARTNEKSRRLSEDAALHESNCFRDRELCIIESRNDIENPKQTFKANV